MKLSLEQEKYLCMLNGLNAFRLIKLEQQKQVQVGLSSIKNNSHKLEEYKSQLEMINTILEIRSLSN